MFFEAKRNISVFKSTRRLLSHLQTVLSWLGAHTLCEQKQMHDFLPIFWRFLPTFLQVLPILGKKTSLFNVNVPSVVSLRCTDTFKFKVLLDFIIELVSNIKNHRFGDVRHCNEAHTQESIKCETFG